MIAAVEQGRMDADESERDLRGMAEQPAASVAPKGNGAKCKRAREVTPDAALLRAPPHKGHRRKITAHAARSRQCDG